LTVGILTGNYPHPMADEQAPPSPQPERFTSGVVRKRRVVRRGPGGEESTDDEFVRVRSSTEEPGGRVIVEHAEGATEADTAEPESPDALIPDEITQTPPPTLDASLEGSAAVAVLTDAVRSFLEGHDGLGADHPVTVDRLERLRRMVILLERS
jgi:hypothetical protein